MFHNNVIYNASVLSSCRNLRTLRLDGNMLESFNGQGLGKLTLLNISNNSISETDGLQRLKRLHTLKATHNALRGLGGLVSLLALEELHLSGNPLGPGSAALKGLHAFKALQALHLDDCGMNDDMLGALHRAMPSVQELSVASNGLTSLQGVAAAFPNLRVLDVSGNHIAQIESSGHHALAPLLSLPSLTELSLAENAVCSCSVHSIQQLVGTAPTPARREAGNGADEAERDDAFVEVLAAEGSWDRAVVDALPSLWVLDGTPLRKLLQPPGGSHAAEEQEVWAIDQDAMLAAGLPTLPSARLDATARVLMRKGGGAGAAAGGSAAPYKLQDAAEAAASAAALKLLREGPLDGQGTTAPAARQATGTAVQRRAAALMGTASAEEGRRSFEADLQRQAGALQLQLQAARGSLASAAGGEPALHVGRSVAAGDPLRQALQGSHGLDALFDSIQRKHAPAWMQDSDEGGEEGMGTAAQGGSGGVHSQHASDSKYNMPLTDAAEGKKDSTGVAAAVSSVGAKRQRVTPVQGVHGHSAATEGDLDQWGGASESKTGIADASEHAALLHSGGSSSGEASSFSGSSGEESSGDEEDGWRQDALDSARPGSRYARTRSRATLPEPAVEAHAPPPRESAPLRIGEGMHAVGDTVSAFLANVFADAQGCMDGAPPQRPSTARTAGSDRQPQVQPAPLARREGPPSPVQMAPQASLPAKPRMNSYLKYLNARPSSAAGARPASAVGGRTRATSGAPLGAAAGYGRPATADTRRATAVEAVSVQSSAMQLHSAVPRLAFDALPRDDQATSAVGHTTSSAPAPVSPQATPRTKSARRGLGGGALAAALAYSRGHGPEEQRPSAPVQQGSSAAMHRETAAQPTNEAAAGPQLSARGKSSDRPTFRGLQAAPKYKVQSLAGSGANIDSRQHSGSMALRPSHSPLQSTRRSCTAGGVGAALPSPTSSPAASLFAWSSSDLDAAVSSTAAQAGVALPASSSARERPLSGRGKRTHIRTGSAAHAARQDDPAKGMSRFSASLGQPSVRASSSVQSASAGPALRKFKLPGDRRKSEQ